MNFFFTAFSKSSTRLTAIFFLRRNPAASAPSARPIRAAEAAARLYANSLNQLAHRGDGLDAAIRITTGTESSPRAQACSIRITTSLSRSPICSPTVRSGRGTPPSEKPSSAAA